MTQIVYELDADGATFKPTGRLNTATQAKYASEFTITIEKLDFPKVVEKKIIFGKTSAELQSLAAIIILIFSMLWILTLVVRILYLYDYASNVNILVLIFSDIGIGVLPLIIVFGIQLVQDTIKKNQKKASRTAKGKDPKFLPLINSYL